MKQISLFHGVTTASLVLTGLIVSATSAQAVLLPPNTPFAPGIVTPGSMAPGQVGPILANLTSNFVGPNNEFSGSITSMAYDDSRPGGGLSFLYQVTNTTPVADPEFLDRVSLFGFTQAAPVNVDFVSLGSPTFNTGTVRTITADSSAGGRVSFNFEELPGLTNGATSRFFYVQTDITGFTTNTANIIGAGVATANVIAPIPEPTTALFGIALLGVLGSRGVRRRPAC